MKNNQKDFGKRKEPIARPMAGETILGGDSNSINPKRKLEKKQPKKSLFQRLFK